MPDFFTLRDDYYEDFSEQYGGGDYAMGLAEDAARADHQRMLAAEEQQRDLIEQDNEIRFSDLFSGSNDSHGLPLQAAATGTPVSGAAIVVTVAVGLLVVGGIWLYKRCNRDKQ